MTEEQHYVCELEYDIIVSITTIGLSGCWWNIDFGWIIPKTLASMGLINLHINVPTWNTGI